MTDELDKAAELCTFDDKANTDVAFHRKHKTKTYHTWANIKTRCCNPNVRSYADYGGRGIKLYEPWHKFDEFFKDIGPIPRHLSIDRIDNDGDYEPNNVRLITAKAQANNRRTNRKFTYNGKTQTIAELAEETGIPSRLIQARVTRLNWSVEKTLTTPPQKNVRYYEGKRLCDWARELNLSRETLRYRILQGWPKDKVLSPDPHYAKPNLGKPSPKKGTGKGYQVVYLRHADRYQLRTKQDGKLKYHGRYDTREEAEEAGKALMAKNT